MFICEIGRQLFVVLSNVTRPYLPLLLPLLLEGRGAGACGADTLMRHEVGHLHVIGSLRVNSEWMNCLVWPEYW